MADFSLRARGQFCCVLPISTTLPQRLSPTQRLGNPSVMLHFGRIHGCFSYQRAGRESERHSCLELPERVRAVFCGSMEILHSEGAGSSPAAASTAYANRSSGCRAQTANGYSDCWNRIVVWSVARSVIATELGAEPRFSPAPSHSPSAFFLLCLSSCSPFRELGLDQVPDYTAVAFCESEFVCQTGFQKHADSVMACQVSCGN